MLRFSFIVGLALIGHSHAFAQNVQLDIATRQLTGIRTVLVQIDRDLVGIDTTAIRNTVESELRRIGMAVRTTAAGVDAVVAVSVIVNPTGTAVACLMQVLQDAQLQRNLTTPAIARWISRVSIARVDPSNLNGFVQQALRDLIPDLTNAYLKANPR